jgi:trehalose-phosphatase
VTTPALPITPALARRLSGSPFALLLDIDGTLSPIAPRPDDAVVPPNTQRVLDELARSPGVQVVAISGRSARDARRLVSLDDVWIIGNHGIEVVPPMADTMVRDDVARFSEQIAAASRRIAEIARAHAGVIVEDKRWTLSIHYRLAERRIVPELRAQVDAVAADLGLRVTHGKEVFELRPPVDIDKGTAAVELARQLGAFDPGASLLCAGDDRTDEDMFRALRRAQPQCVTVRVTDDASSGETDAEFFVADTGAMRTLLEAVLSLRRSGAPVS